MKNVKYWHVKLFGAPTPMGSAATIHHPSSPFFDGYSMIEPFRLSRREDFISLFTAPHGRESRQFRVDDIHSMLATPVYEADEPEQRKDCHCILTAGVDVQKEQVSGIVAGCHEGLEPAFQVAFLDGADGTPMSPVWMNTAQDLLKDLLYKNGLRGDINSVTGEQLANFVYSAFSALDNNHANVSDIINEATKLSQKSCDLQRRMAALYQTIFGEKSPHSCGRESEIPNSRTAVALNRIADVSDDLSSISGMLDDIDRHQREIKTCQAHLKQLRR